MASVGSFPCFDELTKQMLAAIGPESVLDLTTGNAKYGGLAAAAAPNAMLTAIRPGADESQRRDLLSIYHDVVTEAPLLWWTRNADRIFDVAIAADGLSHMPKSAGLDMLNAAAYRAAWTLVVTPEFFLGSTRTDLSLSAWSERDFSWHDRWAWENCRTVSWVLMRGYQQSSLSLEALVDRLNRARIPVRDFDGVATVRPAWLRVVDHPREVSYRPW